jgi:hypothetical protein
LALVGRDVSEAPEKDVAAQPESEGVAAAAWEGLALFVEEPQAVTTTATSATRAAVVNRFTMMGTSMRWKRPPW